jgi:preprotein translocase SecE subunit
MLRKVNDDLKAKYVRVANPGFTSFKRSEVIKKTEFEEAAKAAQGGVGEPPVGVPPYPATGPFAYQTVTLLPGLQYTLPLLLIAAGIWFAWRVVNYPPFADFLIATEAELNKVSWPTRTRLVRDTVVVLVTTVLLAVFLFVMDQTWRVILSWPYIGVLQIDKGQGEQNKNVDQKPW